MEEFFLKPGGDAKTQNAISRREKDYLIIREDRDLKN